MDDLEIAKAARDLTQPALDNSMDWVYLQRLLKKCPVIEYWENKKRMNEYEAFYRMHTYGGTLTKCPRKL